MHIRKAFWGALILFLGLILANLFIKDIAFTRAAAVIALLVITGYFWTNQTISSIDITRHARELRQQAGEIFNERFLVTNNGKLPKLWVEIIDESNIGAEHGSRLLTWLSGHISWPYVTHTLLDKRGVYQLGPTRVIAGDPFGLFYRETTFQGNERLLVLPYYEPISFFPYPMGYLPGGKALNRKSLEVTPYAAGVREYQPGDPLRRIDWKSSARKERLMVKEFDQDPQSNICIFIDASESSNPEKREEVHLKKKPSNIIERKKYALPKDAFEYVISYSAALAEYYVRQEKAVGMISEGQGLYKLAPDLGERQLDKIFEALAIIKNKGQLTFQELIESQINSIQRGSTIVFVSASTDTSLIDVLQAIKARNYVPAFIGVDIASFDQGRSNDELIQGLQVLGINAIQMKFGDTSEKLSKIEG